METESVRAFVLMRVGPNRQDQFLTRRLEWTDDIGLSKLFHPEDTRWLLKEMEGLASAIQVWVTMPKETAEAA